MEGYLEKGIQTPMAQGRSTKIMSTIKWIRTSGLLMKNSLCVARLAFGSSGLEFRILGSGLRVYHDVQPTLQHAHLVNGSCFYGLWFMVYGLWFMVYGLWFMVKCLVFMVWC